MKTNAIRDELNDVQMINATVQFGAVRLNVIAYEIDGVLIDTGAQKVAKEMQAFFKDVRPEQVVLTHFHEDHTGGAAHIQETYGIPIYMNDLSIERCNQKASYPFYRKFFWGKRKPFQAKPIDETFTSRTANWQVVYSPGHADDHLAFLNESTGQLFSGDLYVHPKTKVILREESIPTIIHSIKKVLTYDFGEMFCCHAGYIKDGKQALQHKLQYLEDIEGEVLKLHETGYKPLEIQKILFNRKYPITKLSFGEWDSKHIVTSIIRDSV